MRFIVDSNKPADFNMAADAYLLKQCANHATAAATAAGGGGAVGRNAGHGVTIRFYQWEKPTVTIGYMQDAATELDLEALKIGGAGWIKRVTGGRAVLHDGDVTYSCTFPKKELAMGTGITQTYRIISSCLTEGLRRAGVMCEAHGSSRGGRDDGSGPIIPKGGDGIIIPRGGDNGISTIPRDVKLPCFLAPNRDEIMVDGKKLVGSAQKRTAGGVLQHGSIPINNNYRTLPRYLRIDESEQNRQRELLIRKSCCVDEITTGGRMGAEEIVGRLMEGFSSTLPFDWELVPWSQQEVEEIWGMAGTMFLG